MIGNIIGELAALGTACGRTVAVLAYEEAGKNMGSLSVNLIRLVLGFGFLTISCVFIRGTPFPTDASPATWIWLSLSGFCGFILGDLFAFKAFLIIGSRIAVLISTVSPVLSAIIGWIFLREILDLKDIIGIGLTLAGILMILMRRTDGKIKYRSNYHRGGVFLAIAGAIGQALGLIFAKYGIGELNSLAASQIRIITGIAGFSILFFILRWWPRFFQALGDSRGMLFTSLGAFFGPFLSLTLSLYALKHAPVGVVATLSSLVPVLIIPPAVIIKHDRVPMLDVIAAMVAVGGSTLLFL